MPKYTAIELNENEIKVFQVSRSRKKEMEIDHAFSVSLADLGMDEEAVLQAGIRLREALKNNKIQPGPVGLIIPKQNAILRAAQLPSTDQNELDEMAQFEAEKYIPFNIERHIISNAVMTSDGVEGSQVLVTAVDSPVMERALAILREAKLEPIFAEVSSMALFRALYIYEPEALEQPSAVMLNIGRSQADITLLKDGLLVAARSTSLGLDQLNRSIEKAKSSGEDVNEQDVTISSVRAWIGKITRFTSQTYDYAAREFGISTSSRLYISGEGITLHSLTSTLEESLGIEVRIFNPAEKIARNENGTIDKQHLPGVVTPLGTVHRLIDIEHGTRHRDEGINLLPSSVIEQQQASERKVLLMISGTMVIITLILLYLAYDTQAQHSEQLTKRYKEFISEMRPVVENLEKKEEQLDIIRQITSNRAGMLEILDQIAAFPGMGNTKEGGVLTLEEFKYTVRNDVTVGGTAVNFEDMQSFADYLEQMTIDDKAVFSEVGLPKSKPVDLSQGRGTVYSFSIDCVLNDLAESREREDD